MLLAFLCALLPRVAVAETCTATPTGLTFSDVSPITKASVDGTGTILVSCTWNTTTATPNVLVCLDLTAALPRTLSAGSSSLAYGLYTDNARSIPWGAASLGSTPLTVTLTKPLLSTTASATVTFYGQVTSNQPTVPTQNNATTAYTQTIAAGSTALRAGFYLLGAPACNTIASTGTFGFTVTAPVINNCTIATTNMTFTAANGLTTALTTAGSLSVTCTNNDAYRISLSAGASKNVAARTMQSAAGNSINYQLYTDATRSVVWGDGTGGTAMYTAVGTGLAQTVPVYGLVPIQTTPAPGSYVDTITATIAF
jgi:spore coat protein U-like protein